MDYLFSPFCYFPRLNHSEVRNSSFYQCCSGFCIDLLVKFAENIGFTYELARVQDAKWGTQQNGKWNGLVSELNNRKVDVALASLMINSEREGVVDFSVPFMDSGVAILTAKRTGIISPTAFLGMSTFSITLFLFSRNQKNIFVVTSKARYFSVDACGVLHERILVVYIEKKIHYSTVPFYTSMN